MFNDFFVEQDTMKKNVWQMLDSYLCTQEDLEKDNGHSLVLVLRRSGTLSKKTVLKENGTKWRKGCCWNSQRADVQFSVLRPHCPDFILKKQRTRWTVDTLCSRPGNDWDYFSHNGFCKPAQSLRSSRRDMWRVWIPSRENEATRCDGTIKFLTRAQCDQDSSLGLSWPSESNISVATRWRTNWEAVTTRQNEDFFVWMHDFWMLLKLDNTSGRKTRQISHNLIQWHVVNTLFQEEKKKHHHRKAGSKETPKLGPYWKLQPVIFTLNTELRSEFGLWTDNTHSWVRISYGSNKFVMKLNNIETEIPEDQLEEYA